MPGQLGFFPFSHVAFSSLLLLLLSLLSSLLSLLLLLSSLLSTAGPVGLFGPRGSPGLRPPGWRGPSALRPPPLFPNRFILSAPPPPYSHTSTLKHGIPSLGLTQPNPEGSYEIYRIVYQVPEYLFSPCPSAAKRIRRDKPPNLRVIVPGIEIDELRLFLPLPNPSPEI